MEMNEGTAALLLRGTGLDQLEQPKGGLKKKGFQTERKYSPAALHCMKN